MPVEQVLRLPPFVNALRTQRAAKDEYRRRLRAGELRKGKANEVTDAERVDKNKARKQREPDARPGLPSSGEEVSQKLGMVLPPSYTEVLIPFHEDETRNKPRRKVGHSQ